jgi:hypothetical protein
MMTDLHQLKDYPLPIQVINNHMIMELAPAIDNIDCVYVVYSIYASAERAHFTHVSIVNQCITSSWDLHLLKENPLPIVCSILQWL